MSGHTGGHGGKCAHYGGYYGGGHGKPNGYAQNDGADVENAETAGHGGHHGGHSGGYSTVKCLTEDHYECFVSVPTRTYSTNGKSTSRSLHGVVVKLLAF